MNQEKINCKNNVGPFDEAGIPCKQYDTQPITIMTPTHDYRLVARRTIGSRMIEKRIILQRAYLENDGASCKVVWRDVPTVVEEEQNENQHHD